jgi:hypothetical protein
LGSLVHPGGLGATADPGFRDPRHCCAAVFTWGGQAQRYLRSRPIPQIPVKVDAGEPEWQFLGVNSEKDPGVRPWEFPVMDRGNPYVPKDRLCPWCQTGIVHEPNSMAILNGGALLMSEDRQSGGMDPRLDGFFSLSWHGAHGGGLGEYADQFSTLRVADNCPGGQFEMYFCSTSCLRAFLNKCVDELEKLRAESQKKSDDS